MRLLNISLVNVRRFANERVALSGFANGVSVWAARNETGKSTLIEALHAVFLWDYKSNAAEVRGLMPYSGGSPDISVSFEAGGTSWTVRKVFGRRSLAEVLSKDGLVVAQNDAVQPWLEKTFPDLSLAIDVLWARQKSLSLEPSGMGAVEKRLREETRHRRKGLLSVAAAALDAGLGGARFDKVRASLSAQLFDIRTPSNKPRVGGPLDFALRRAKDADAALSVAQSQRDAAQLAVEKRAAARAADVRASAALDAARATLTAKQDALSLARAAAQEQGAKLASLKDVSDALAQADTRLLQAEHARGERARVEKALAAATKAADTAAKEEKIAAVAVESARTALNSATRALDMAQAEVVAARATLLGREAFAVDDRRAVLSAVPRPLLSRAECEGWERTRAQIDALTDVSDDALVDVSWEGTSSLGDWEVGAVRSLKDGERVAFSGGAFVVRAPGGHAREKRRQDLISQEAAYKAQAGVDYPRSAWLVLDAFEKASAELVVLDARAHDFGSDVVRVSGCVKDAARALEEASVSLQQKEREKEKSAAAVERAAWTHATALETCARCQATLEASRKEVAVLAVPDQSGEELVAARDALRVQVNVYKATFALLQNAQGEISALEKEAAALASKMDALSAQCQVARDARTAADTLALNAAESDPVRAFDAAAREARDAHKEVQMWEHEMASLSLAIETLDAARATRSIDIYEPARLQLDALIGDVFGPSSTEFGGESLLPESVARGSVRENVESLSEGTQDALHILTRLAYARVLREKGVEWPLILDDSFAKIDEGRLTALGRVLAAAGQQVLAVSGRENSLDVWGAQKVSLSAQPL